MLNSFWVFQKYGQKELHTRYLREALTIENLLLDLFDVTTYYEKAMSMCFGMQIQPLTKWLLSAQNMVRHKSEHEYVSLFCSHLVFWVGIVTTPIIKKRIRSLTTWAWRCFYKPWIEKPWELCSGHSPPFPSNGIRSYSHAVAFSTIGSSKKAVEFHGPEV